MRNVVHYLCSGPVDAVGYYYQTAYDLEIASVTTDAGRHQVFGANAEFSRDRPTSVEQVMLLSLANESLRRALAELRLERFTNLSTPVFIATARQRRFASTFNPIVRRTRALGPECEKP
jgi:hypothetical protein